MDNFIHWLESILNFIWFVVVPFVGWLIKSILDLRKENANMRIDLADYKVEAEKNFAAKSDLNLLFQKLDAVQTAVTSRIDTMQHNVATMIANTKK